MSLFLDCVARAGFLAPRRARRHFTVVTETVASPHPLRTNVTALVVRALEMALIV
jgi:hypothetical protein